MIVALILVVNILIYIEIPNSLLPSMIYFLGSICMGFFFYTFIMLILREFWTYLLIYEKGIGILLTSIIPFKFKREYIPYENIIDVKVGIDDFNLETLYVYVKNRDPYDLDEFDISDLQEVEKIIKEKIKNYN